jgi:hypothetical protein
VESKYRYNSKAGALNEASPAQNQSQALPSDRIAVSNPSPDETSGLFSLNSLSRIGHAGPSGIPAAAPSLHAQSVGALQVAPSSPPARRGMSGLDRTHSRGWISMFYYTVEDGQRVLMKRPDGTMEVLVGPRRVRRKSYRFEPMAHYVAHPGEFLIVRFRDGRQEHHPGPANVWLDPREHLEISKEDVLQIAAKEAVVVYSEGDGGQISRRLVYGPEVFVPKPGEWLHTFSWHGSRGGDKGYQKVPNALVFQKLWLMPDQMYHDVSDVRTADDAVLTIRLMLFFELLDIETMLGATHDPIGDFVNAATSDVVDFMGKHDFDSWKRHTARLNELATYPQLVARAEQCGYRINKIVYRGYGAPDSLQRMHDEAIESRTKLQLERATEQQAQELQDFKLERQLARGQRERSEADAQARHDIEVQRLQREAQLQHSEREREFQRVQERKDHEQKQQLARVHKELERAHLSGLRELGVNLTELLTQGRADQIIELRGGSGPAHLHVKPTGDGGGKTG